MHIARFTLAVLPPERLHVHLATCERFVLIHGAIKRLKAINF